MLAIDRLVTDAPTDEWRDSTSAEHEPTCAGIYWVFPEPVPRLTLLNCSRLLLGRGDDCNVRLIGGETSRHHCEIVRVGPTLRVRDLGSRNGVFLNGVRVRDGQLTVGSVLRVGRWIGVLVEARPSSAFEVFGELGPGLLGGPVLRPVVELARQAAISSLPIIIEGETGTGKELFARAIHHWSGRVGPFRAINCAALPEGLAEGEFFGYRRGAFTGAERTSLGHFRAAESGTLLLDEILDMPGPLQAKVLRTLEQREVLPLGETRPVPVDVRIIAATQHSLAAAVAHGFRGDLFARLNGIQIRLPPLRERIEEIPWLFCRLLERNARGRIPDVEPTLIEQLCVYDWPFNMRELDLLTRQLIALHGHESVLTRDHLPSAFHRKRLTRGDTELQSSEQGRPSAVADEPAKVAAAPIDRTAQKRERDSRDLEALESALQALNGNMSQAAARVGISRQRAYRLVEWNAGRTSANIRKESPPIQHGTESGDRSPSSDR